MPKAPIAAMGTRAYLSCTLYEELVKNHCLIVPIQHHLSMLEADDDTWDEVRVSHSIDSPSSTNQVLEFHEVRNAHVCRG